MSILSVARDYLEQAEYRISHNELVLAVVKETGYSRESVRGSIIKRNGGLLDLKNWQYVNGEFIRCSEEQSGLIIKYNMPSKIATWDKAREYLPYNIKSMITLGGEEGNCIESFNPELVVSYDTSSRVLDKLKQKFPKVETVCADIFRNEDQFEVANIDLVGYLCDSLCKNLHRVNESEQYEYIVLTLQGQKGIRNHGNWVNEVKYTYRDSKDMNLDILIDLFSNYKLLHWHFYKRCARARRMRTLVFKRLK